MKNVEQEVDILMRQMRQQRNITRDLYEFMDCLTSPLHKRVWWWFGGYYFRKVGRWYSDQSMFYKIWLFIAKLVRCP